MSYNRWADWYNRLEPLLILLLGLKKIRRQWLKKAEGEVLEVAIGGGSTLADYPFQINVTGVDSSPKMLACAQKKTISSNRSITLTIGDVESLAFSDSSFDTVVDSMGLCTFSNPVRALQEMKRVARKKILLIEHGKSHWKGLARLQDRWAKTYAKPLGCYWNRDPIQLVQEAGLTPKGLKRYRGGMIYLFEIEMD